MEVGRYYLKRHEYLSAINRFKQVVENYQTTTHVPEALHRLVECYLALGVTEEAKKYAAVLGYNYPSSEWYGYSYAMMEGKELPKPKGKGIVGKLMSVF
jgi:outer membrane protein assembly factor BamD